MPGEQPALERRKSPAEMRHDDFQPGIPREHAVEDFDKGFDQIVFARHRGEHVVTSSAPEVGPDSGVNEYRHIVRQRAFVKRIEQTGIDVRVPVRRHERQTGQAEFLDAALDVVAIALRIVERIDVDHADIALGMPPDDLGITVIAYPAKLDSVRSERPGAENRHVDAGGVQVGDVGFDVGNLARRVAKSVDALRKIEFCSLADILKGPRRNIVMLHVDYEVSFNHLHAPWSRMRELSVALSPKTRPAEKSRRKIIASDRLEFSL